MPINATITDAGVQSMDDWRDCVDADCVGTSVMRTTCRRFGSTSGSRREERSALQINSLYVTRHLNGLTNV
jgi:hypothetical protein